MPDESYGFSQTRARLDEIVTAVRKKNTSLEASLDLLEEGVRLANRCTELIDHADWESAMVDAQGEADAQAPEDVPESVDGSGPQGDVLAEVRDVDDEHDDVVAPADDDETWSDAEE